MTDREKNPQLYKLQEVNLQMIRLFDAICREEGLTYYAVGGTLLGAVRHHGFIPWDDDVDLCMPRPDYQKFVRLGPAWMPAGYRLRTIGLNDEYRTYIAKIEDLNVSFLRDYYARGGIVQKKINAWIDIMPIDGAPEDEAELAAHVQRIRRCKQLLSLSMMDRCMGVHKNRSDKERFVIKAGLATGLYKLVDSKRAYKNLVKECRRYPYATAPMLGNSYGIYDQKEYVPRAVFGTPIRLAFEDMAIASPADPDAYLRHVYGDYMTLPPENEREGHVITFA